MKAKQQLKNLRQIILKKIKKEILIFTDTLLKISDINNIPIDLQKELKESLSKESPFSAFKRWIVKNNKKYSSLESIFD